MQERIECLRCGHQWYRRQDSLPVQCPKCRSSYWDRPRTAEKRLVPRIEYVGPGAERVDFETAPAEVSGGEPDAERCPYRELNRDSNEWVYCALGPHDPKTRHVPGRRVAA